MLLLFLRIQILEFGIKMEGGIKIGFWFILWSNIDGGVIIDANLQLGIMRLRWPNGGRNVLEIHIVWSLEYFAYFEWSVWFVLGHRAVWKYEIMEGDGPCELEFIVNWNIMDRMERNLDSCMGWIMNGLDQFSEGWMLVEAEQLNWVMVWAVTAWAAVIDGLNGLVWSHKNGWA